MYIDMIKKRKSVRTFEKKPLSQQQLETLRSYIDSIKTPFEIDIHLELLHKEYNDLGSPVLVNDEWYVGGKIPKTPLAQVAYGYAFEKFILKAEEMGLGTVWLAATIKRSAFEKALDVKEDEVMPAISPIGYAADKRSAREKLMRKGMNSDHRQPFEILFFDRSFSKPLVQEEAGQWQIPLEMVRLAPSATNKQPWRIVVDSNKVYFYEKKTKGYANEKEGDIQRVDLGIAMCHFDLACLDQGIHGEWEIKDPLIEAPENTDYIATFIQK